MMDYVSTNAGIIGLLFFFAFFMAVIAFVFKPGSKDSFKEHARIPLEEND